MEESNKIELTKPEFFGVMMIYAANIDGEEHKKEIEVIRASIGERAFERCYELYNSMNDYELINFFRDNKGEYFKSEMDEKIFMSEIKTVISADHEIDIMENTLILAFKKILKEWFW